jgi:hypothetical protein
MMSKFKKLYREFFGLAEQKDLPNPAEVSKVKDAFDELAPSINAVSNSIEKVQMQMGESELDEAQLVNNLTDYRGGVEYVLRDPATANSVAQEILEWAERKGFTVIKKTISPTGKIGYFYFRLGQDPALESQKLQGYLAQKPELKHFRFNVRQQTPKQPTGKI